MTVERMISMLKAERDRLDVAIISIERLSDVTNVNRGTAPEPQNKRRANQPESGVGRVSKYGKAR